ncbi:MAG: 2-oxoacid:acceptor oxidoreductase family protein, partial [Methanothrix sp.]
MDNFSTLIGGIAGDGINEAGITLSRLFGRLGYHIYMYYDYPSLIRGGHNFSLVRASRQKIAAHMDQIDVLIALNQETVEKHTGRLKDSSIIIYDAD